MTLLSALLLSAIASANADEALLCALSRPGAPALELRSPLRENEAAVTTAEANELRLFLDASLSPQSFLLITQDDRDGGRVAFTASPQAVLAGPSSLSVGEARARCETRVQAAPIPTPPPAADFLACALDEALFADGSVAGSRRLAVKAVSLLHRTLPARVRVETGDLAFSVDYTPLDSSSGLSIRLTDRSTGKSARYDGPAAGLKNAFLLALTQGDRAKQARMLRLGCLWTNDPKALER